MCNKNTSCFACQSQKMSTFCICLSICYVLSSLSQRTDAYGSPDRGLFMHLYILSCSREAGAATIFCFFNLQTPQNLPDQTVSSLGKRPIDDDHDHHSLRGRLAQCKPSMSSTVRTFFGVEQLRAPPSRPQSCYVCQRQTTKVKDKIITHYTYKE